MGEIKINPDGTHTITGGFSNKRQEDIDLVGNTIFKKPSESDSLKESEETKPKFTKEELIKMTRKQQEKIAKELGLKNLSKLKEKELIDVILKAL